MRSYQIAALAMPLVLPLCAQGTVGVQQLEAFDGTGYAAIDFGGVSPVVGTGDFSGVTFHALNSLNSTFAQHAHDVGEYIYGMNSSPAKGIVTDVYAGAADDFVDYVVKGQTTTSATGTLPGHFNSNAKIINNSYVALLPSDDTQRRLDFMIDRDDVTFVAAAADTGTLVGNYVAWSSYNSLAVSGSQGFDPSTSPGKAHADLGFPGLEASYETGQVSGYAAALYGKGQAALQTDALHGQVIKSLLMTGADKIGYTRQTANNLSFTIGAGQPDYNNSLSVLQGGELPLQTAIGSSVPGTLSTQLQGWTYGNVAAAGKSVVMFHTTTPITGVTASLNWDVTSASTATTIDTTDAGVIFPHLNLEVRSVIFSNGQYVLGASLGDTTLQSNASNDNEQYLYSTSTLPAGSYAFVITGDSTRTPAVGFSYNVISNTTPNQWDLTTGASWQTPSAWSHGIPNGAGAQANFLATPSGLTSPGSITLNNNTVVGEITFNNAQSYSIDPGTGGTLTINDSGDAGGVFPAITVISGTHSITAPVSLANGVTVNTEANTGLNITGNLTGTGGMIITGHGALTLGGIDNYGDTTVVGGALTINGVIASQNVIVASGASLTANGQLSSSTILTNFGTVVLGANTGTTVIARTLSNVLIGAGGQLTAAASSSDSNRTVLVTGSLAIANAGNTWTGKLDLNNNDMIVKGGSLTNIVSQLKSGFNAGQGYWNGATGIISTSASTNNRLLTTLGVIQNSDSLGNPIYGLNAPYGLFDGQNPSVADVLVKYTYYGDADLNGTLDGRDYAKIDAGFQLHLTGWVNGDFNYDGVVNGTDFALIDNTFNQQQAAHLSPLSIAMPAALQTTSSVPEPASFAVVLTSATALAARRQRHNRHGFVTRA